MSDPDDKEEESPWPEQAFIPQDDEMIEQLPDEDYVPITMAGQYGPTDETGEPIEYGYTIGYDKVLTLDLERYTEAEAQMKLNGLCVLRNVRPTEKMFYTARKWCLRVVQK